MRNKTLLYRSVLSLSFLFFMQMVVCGAPAPAAPAKAEAAAPVATPKPAATAPAKAAAPAAAAEQEEEAADESAEQEAEDPIDLEISFMKGLVRYRMPDYAQKALDKLVQKNPEAKARASSIKIDILAGVGNYADAEKLIASMPADTLETWIMKLALAEHYYQAGKMTEAKTGYGAFFKKYEKGPPPGMGKFYMEQAYKYAQMLMFKNEEKEAVDAFGYVLRANPPRDIEFKIRMDLAELCMKLSEKTKDVKERDIFFKKAKDACDPILWKDNGSPLFGKALMILAHMEMIKGDKKAARKLIDTYMPMLKDLEKVLIENKISLDFSPLAQCRYLLGTIAEEEGKALFAEKKIAEAQGALTTALTHYVNVVARYQTSQWALPAGEAQDRVALFMKNKMGLKVEIPPFNRDKIIQALLKEAQAAFEQNLFEDAAKKYLLYVNHVPETGASVAALGELAKCYLEIGNTNYFKVVLGYLAERFHANTDLEESAGNALLRAAAAAETINNKEARKEIYDQYIKFYQSHRRMAGVLFQFGDVKFKEKDYDQAIDYYQQIVTNTYFAKSPVYFPALGKLAGCYTMLNDYSNAVQVLTNTIAVLPPGPDEIETRYRLADTYRRMDMIPHAIGQLVTITNTVNGANKGWYSKTPEDSAKTKSLMESVYFWKAYCYAMLTKPVEYVKAYQQMAINDFTKFVADYPKSTLSSTALSRLGSLLYAAGRTDEANKVFDRLVKEYPDSPEAKDVVFVQFMSLIDLKKMDKAIEVVDKMLATEGKFNAAQFLRVGKIMADAKEYPTAIKFFDRSKKMATKDKAVDRAIWEPAVFGMAEAFFAQGKSAEAAKAVEELFARFQATPLFVEASFVLSKSYAELGAKESDTVKKQKYFVQAQASMAKGMTPITNAVTKFKANLLIADVQTMLGDKGAATASYFRMIGMGDWNDPEIRPDMEIATAKGLPLLFEKKMFEEVVQIGNKYLDACPRGAHVIDVRRLRDKARFELAQQGKTVETVQAPSLPPPGEVPPAAVPAGNEAATNTAAGAAEK